MSFEVAYERKVCRICWEEYRVHAHDQRRTRNKLCKPCDDERKSKIDRNIRQRAKRQPKETQ